MSTCSPLYSPLALVAADDHDRRDVQAARGHELAGRRLVAGREADHAVEQRAFDLHLDVVGDEVARSAGCRRRARPRSVMKSLGAAVRISNGTAAGGADRFLRARRPRRRGG